VVIGAGGHGRETWDIARACSQGTPYYPPFELLGFLDDGIVETELLERLGAPHLGGLASLETLDCDYIIGIGTPAIRERIDHHATSVGVSPATLIHPTAWIGSDVAFEVGSVVAQHCVITTNVRIGRHTHVNVGASISHDCRLEDYVTISPGCVVCGNVSVASSAYLGASSCVVQGVKIGSQSMVGAGALVRNDVLQGQTVVGVPARPIP
jgi:sugar O-acyltransferase (sialic acid O-acetyltransferase NeuD family)